MESLITDITAYATAIAGVITACTVITAMTPTQVDDKVFGKLTVGINFLLRILNVLAGNVAKNKNLDDKKE